MIDYKRKLIFIHITRTGGTSVEKALVGKDWWFKDPKTKHISARQAKEIYGESIWNTYTKFSIVRNPWDRVVSMWATGWWHQNLPQNSSFSDFANYPFEEFIKNLKPHPTEKYNTLFYNEIINEEINYILRFENLDSDFKNMMDNIGIDSKNIIPFPHIQGIYHKHYSLMYNEKEKNMVAELFKSDIIKFNYNFL